MNQAVKKKRDSLLTYKQSKHSAHLDCEINLLELFPAEGERQKFKNKFKPFFKSDADNFSIYKLENHSLSYTTEQLIPAKTDKRPPLLLILGNPATHSIKNGMFFSPKKDGEENRFWKNLLKPAGVLDLVCDKRIFTSARNKLRLECMFELNYESPFRIGLCVYWSMPSNAGGTWSGVAGIRKLIGKRAMERLEPFERERIMGVITRFLEPGGAVVTFQKDAWNGLRSFDDPEYRIELAKTGKLRGSVHGLPNIPLFGVPLTRLAGPSSKILRNILTEEGYKLPKERI
jgi:hypothetical protein